MIRIIGIIIKSFIRIRISGEWEGWTLLNRFNHTGGVTAVNLTDRPESVRNRCVIEVFGGFFLCCTVAFWTFLYV